MKEEQAEVQVEEEIEFEVSTDDKNDSNFEYSSYEESSEVSQSQPTNPDKIVAYWAIKIIANWWNPGIKNLPMDRSGIFERTIKAAIWKHKERSKASQAQPTDPDKIKAYPDFKIISNRRNPGIKNVS